MSPIAVFSLTSTDLPLTEITFTQLNPTSSRDDAVAPRGSRQRALQRHPTIHSTWNEINPTNSTLGPRSTQDFPHVGVTSFTLLCHILIQIILNWSTYLHLSYNDKLPNLAILSLIISKPKKWNTLLISLFFNIDKKSLFLSHFVVWQTAWINARDWIGCMRIWLLNKGWVPVFSSTTRARDQAFISPLPFANLESQKCALPRT